MEGQTGRWIVEPVLNFFLHLWSAFEHRVQAVFDSRKENVSEKGGGIFKMARTSLGAQPESPPAFPIPLLWPIARIAQHAK
jgi:hypothetical protein